MKTPVPVFLIPKEDGGLNKMPPSCVARAPKVTATA